MRSQRTPRRGLYGAVLLAAAALSCDGGTADVPDQGAAPVCTAEPQTHLEIINSCSDPPGIDKPARLAKFRPGAPLQPLP